MNRKVNIGILWTLLGLLLICSNNAYGQKDPVLFTVADKAVHLSEFEYIYSKTNGKSASYSEESINEYLDLYKKFKLKVAAAKEMKLDTIPSLQQELEGYRRQLADSYLTDKEVTEKLTREAYDRSLYDISLSHLLVRVKPDASPADSLAAYNKAIGFLNQIKNGEHFALVATNHSDDKGTKDRGGDLGYLVAPFPNGFYALETAAYNAKVDEVTGPIRTKLGYHLIQIKDKRSARGEVEAAHILIRFDEKQGNVESAKAKIDSLYRVAKGEGDFKALATKHSEDKTTAVKGGYIGFFGVNRFQRSFEDAAFALQENGDISEPIRSKVGFHIIQRLGRRDQESYKMAKRRLQPKIKKDDRFVLAKKAMIERIKKEGKYTPSPATLSNWLSNLGDDFLTFKWKPSASENAPQLFAFENGLAYTLADFEKYCQKNSRLRIRKSGNAKPSSVAMELYDSFVDDGCIKYEESQLEKKYPEFKALMREYEEGILLFEATKIKVWDRASQDTVGLKRFHENYKQKYMWGERARVSEITISPEGKNLMPKINKYAVNHNAAEISKKFNKGGKTFIVVTEKIFEKGKDDLVDAIEWIPGNNSEIRIDNGTKKSTFYQIIEKLPPSAKSLNEARGYIIADYQDALEKDWIESLRRKYKINVNQKVLKNMIK